MQAFTFPGQGSQRPGMGRPWLDHPAWALVADASELAHRDVSFLLLDADAEELRRPASAQLSTFVISVMTLAAVEERGGPTPAFCAGHSLGEYTALVAAGALSFEDGVRIVSARGRAMDSASIANPGSMAVILGLEDADAEAACRIVEGEVWVANYNAPGQVVIAGRELALAAAADAAKDLGARRVVAIPVGGAFHTPLMAPAELRLRDALAAATVLPPHTTVMANVDARAHFAPEEWPRLLCEHMCTPVQWRRTLEHLARDGVDTFVELGPGGVLTGLARRTVAGARTAIVSAPSDIEKLHVPVGRP
jgi:[acyl-carrier-protein] S-malonyltransferase